MGINKEARSRAGYWVNRLDDFTVPELRQLARVIDAYRGRRVKGGKYQPFRKAELIKSIRRVVGQGTFADRLNRFADLAEKLAG